jgi:hypothetical protein
VGLTARSPLVAGACNGATVCFRAYRQTHYLCIPVLRRRFSCEGRQILSHDPRLTLLLRPIEFVGCLP